MKINKKRKALLGVASSLAVSLTACDTQALNGFFNASEEYSESQESAESSQIIDETLGYKESNLGKEYAYSDLYVLNTGLLGAENPKYYIIEEGTIFTTSIGEIAYNCGPKNCYYAEKGSKNDYSCYAISYKTVGLEEEQNIYQTLHYPSGYYDNYIYLTVNDYLFTLEPGGRADYDDAETELFQTFDNSIIFFASVINPNDLKNNYTEAELIELMKLMNSGEYEFNEEYTTKVNLSK